MKEKLASLGIPAREIKVYGRQITVECLSRDAAEKFAAVLSKFATVRGIIKTIAYAKKNSGTVLVPSSVSVHRVYATV